MSYSQSYGSVGTVYNAENLYIQGNLGMAAPADEPVPERATLAATLVDREPQLGDIVERLAVFPAGEAVGIVAVMQGCDADLHRAFVLRCARIELPKAMAEAAGQEAAERRVENATAWRYLGRLPWPEDGGGIMALLRTLRDRLSLPKRPDQAGIEQEIAKFAGNICFSHFVNEEAWAADGGALVRDWIDYLGSNALRPVPGYRLVAFLCIEQSETPATSGGFAGFLARLGLTGAASTRDTEALSAYLSDLRRRCPRNAPEGRIVVPPPLGLIRRNHVGEAISAFAAYLGDDRLEAQLLTFPHELFKDEGGRRFETVFTDLQVKLAKALPPQARFVEVNR